MSETLALPCASKHLCRVALLFGRVLQMFASSATSERNKPDSNAPARAQMILHVSVRPARAGLESAGAPACFTSISKAVRQGNTVDQGRPVWFAGSQNSPCQTYHAQCSL
eukprot:8803294-Pyramimonas_sp.AAC.1